MIPTSYKFYVILFRKPPFDGYTYGANCVPSGWIRLRDVETHRVGVGFPPESSQFTSSWVQCEVPYSNNWVTYDADVISWADNYDDAIIHTNMSINLLIRQYPIHEPNYYANSVTPEQILVKPTDQRTLVASQPQTCHAYTQTQIYKTADTHTIESHNIQAAVVETPGDSVMKQTERLNHSFDESLEKSSNTIPLHAKPVNPTDQSDVGYWSHRLRYTNLPTKPLPLPPPLHAKPVNPTDQSVVDYWSHRLRCHSNQKRIGNTADTRELRNIQTEIVKTSADSVMKQTESLNHSFDESLKNSNTKPPNENREIQHKARSYENIKDAELRSSKVGPACKRNATGYIKEENPAGSQEPTWSDIQGRFTTLCIEIDKQSKLYNETIFQFMAVNRFNRALLELLHCYYERKRNYDFETLQNSSLSLDTPKTVDYFYDVILSDFNKVKFKLSHNIVQHTKIRISFFDDFLILIGNLQQVDKLSAEVKKNSITVKYETNPQCQVLSSENCDVGTLEIYIFSDDDGKRFTEYLHKLITKQSSVLFKDHIELLQETFLVQFHKDLKDLCEINDKMIYKLNDWSGKIIELLSNCHSSMQLLHTCQILFPDNSTSFNSPKQRKLILRTYNKLCNQLNKMKDCFSKELLMYLKRTIHTFRNIPNSKD